MASPADSRRPPGQSGVPPGPPARLSDQAVERVLGLVLRTGVLVAASLVLAGGVLYLLKHGVTHPDYRRFVGDPGDLNHLEGIIRAARAGQGSGVIQVGCVALIATPVLRVVASLTAFMLQRDRLYTLLTAIVLVVLLAGLAGLAP
jgi:uncharacterized membrane protein